ncbi:hypothetical protein B6R96_01550 [Streptomyces sp. Sge12]|nr:hypothetical protein B6R96_01550 [Streptomyces sp. Sge12]
MTAAPAPPADGGPGAMNSGRPTDLERAPYSGKQATKRGRRPPVEGRSGPDRPRRRMPGSTVLSDR